MVEKFYATDSQITSVIYSKKLVYKMGLNFSEHPPLDLNVVTDLLSPWLCIPVTMIPVLSICLCDLDYDNRLVV